jgi:hypothetical protein
MTTCWSCESLVEAQYDSDEFWIEGQTINARCLDCGNYVPTTGGR